MASNDGRGGHVAHARWLHGHDRAERLGRGIARRGIGQRDDLLRDGTTQAEVYLLPVLIRGREILADQGIGLEYAALSDDEVVSAAVASGRVDVALNSLTGTQRAIKAGLGMRWTLTNETQNTFVFVTHKDVTDLAQLAGKKIDL